MYSSEVKTYSYTCRTHSIGKKYKKPTRKDATIGVFELRKLLVVSESLQVVDKHNSTTYDMQSLPQHKPKICAAQFQMAVGRLHPPMINKENTCFT